MELLFTGAEVYDGQRLARQDVRVKDGLVAEMGPALAPGAARVVKAEGCVLAPGFTDLHVHLRQPGFEQKETVATGTAAAAAGGFTTVCAMPNLNPVPDSAAHLQQELDIIERDAKVRVLPYGALTVGEKGGELADIAAMARLGAVGFSDDGVGVQSEDMMRAAMAEVAKAGGFVAAHCEVDALIEKGAVTVQAGSDFARRHGFTGVSSESEWREVERNIRLAEETGCRLHICHTSTKESFALVREAKRRGLPVTCEVTPHNLWFSCNDIAEDNGRFKMNPPFRGRKDVAAAVQAVKDGTVDAIATDHAPHTAEDKAGGFAKSANGVVGLETAFAAAYTILVKPGHIPLEALLRLFTAGPARVLGEAAAPLAPGQPANLCLIDIAAERIVDEKAFLTMGALTPFDRIKLKAWPKMTIINDNLIFAQN